MVLTRLSLEAERKRLIVPRVRISSLVIPLPKDEGGAIGDEDRRKKGLNNLLGLDVQLEAFLWSEGVPLFEPVGVISSGP